MLLPYKTIVKRFRFIFFVFAFSNNFIASAQEKILTAVIFDTDMGPDYDDVGAIAMLHAFADSGEAKILATMASNKNPPTAAILSLFNTWFNRPDIPVGVPKGAGVNLPAIPTTIIFSGFEIGVEILTGLPLINDASIQNSPVKDVFAVSIPFDPQDKNGRMSWDQTAVLVAVRGWEKYYTLNEGRFIISSDGSNAWDNNGKGHFHLVKKAPSNEMAALINQLIMHQPVKNVKR